MKNKAFTLIELLAVLIIITLISGLALISVGKKGTEYKNISSSKLEDLFETAAHSYIISDDNLVNLVKSGEYVEISVNLLVEKNYLLNKTIINPKTNKEIDTEKSIIKISYSNNKYVYDIVIFDKSVNK